jgi:trk system potassium uptake protein TrkH
MKQVVANLGFVLQTSGVITLLSVIPGFIYDEQTQLVAFFMTASVFLVAGFAMNAMSQKKDLDFKSSCVLISLVFVLLGVIGAIPYFYSNIFISSSIPIRIVNSLFESVSGFTTTGLSVIDSPGALPKSLIFYRALTQWIGGIGIVFIILVFVSSNGALVNLGKAIGFSRLTSVISNSYIRILGIYTAYTALFFGLLYAFGLRDWLNNISLVFSAVSTGGFSPVDNLTAITAFPVNILLGLAMMIGAISFVVHYRLFNGHFKKAPNLEFVTYLLITLVFTIFFALLTRTDMATAFFHVASASSTTGFSYMDLTDMAPNAKTLLLILMFVGGMTSSTAGGLKVMNMLVFFKSIPWVIKGVLKGELDRLSLRSREYKHLEVFSPLVVIILGVVIIIGFAFAFMGYGFSMVDSIFNMTSTLSNTGLYVGVAVSALPAVLKLILTVLMIVGRIGLIALLVALFPKIKAATTEVAVAADSEDP